MPIRKLLGLLMLITIASSAAQAEIVTISVMVENLAPTNSISVTPLRVGFNNGTYDAFNAGQPAGASIISIAEGGTGIA